MGISYIKLHVPSNDPIALNIPGLASLYESVFFALSGEMSWDMCRNRGHSLNLNQSPADIKMKPYDNKVVCLVMRCGSKAVEVRSFLRTLAPRQQFVLSCGRKLRASWAFVYWNRIQVFISPSSLSLEHAKENKMHIILSRRDDFFRC